MPTNVSDVTQQLREIIQNNPGLQDIWIQGEISDINHAQNGHTHFTLRDPGKKIECVIFNDRVPIPANLLTVGNSISVKGQIDIYRTRSEYRFVVTEINAPGNPLTPQPISVRTLTETLKNTLAAHRGEVQGEISELFVTPADFTILKLKDVTIDGSSDDIIECTLPPEVPPPFPFETGMRVHVIGIFGIFADVRAYRIEINDRNNIRQITEQPPPSPSTLNECRGCPQRFNNLRDGLCHICYDANLTSEGIVVGAVMRYFERFADFSTQREYEICFVFGAGRRIRGRADVALLNNERNPVAIAECKKIGYDRNNWRDQLEGYINQTDANLGLFADNTDPCGWTFIKRNDQNNGYDQITRAQFERELGVEPVPEIPPTQTRLELIYGNIVEVEVEAIVNAADPNLTRGTGVDGTIRDAVGEEIEQEWQNIFNGEPVYPPGGATITIGGNLAKYVIHAVGPIWQGGNRSEPDLLADCYKNSLQLAAEKGIRSVAFPAISTGNYGYPIEKAAPVALKTVKEFVEQAHQNNQMVPERIQFVLFDEEAYTCYVNAFSRLGFGLFSVIG